MPYSVTRLFRFVLGPMVLLSLSFAAAAQTDLVSTSIQGLQSGDPDVRLASVRWLARHAKAQAVEPLIGVLYDSDADVRGVSVTELGWLKDTRATEPIIVLLNDSDPKVTYLAAQALGMIGDIRAVEPLISALQRKNLSLQSAAAVSLGQIKDPRAFEPLVVLLRGDLQTQAGDALVAIGSAVVEPLCLILLNEDHPLRYYAAGVLTRIREPRAIKRLISVLGVRVNGIGQMAADGLARIGTPAVDELIVCLANEDPVIRRLAIKALGEIRGERALESILAALKDENLDVRRQALGSVTTFQDYDVTEVALTALHDPGLRVEASLVLGWRKHARAVPYLVETLRGTDPLNASQAQRALAIIGEPAVNELIVVLKDRNPEYPMREVRQLLELSKQGPPQCGNEPPPPILDPRRLAAIALGQIGDQRAITALTEAIKEQSPGLRADAVQALAKITAAAG